MLLPVGEPRTQHCRREIHFACRSPAPTSRLLQSIRGPALGPPKLARLTTALSAFAFVAAARRPVILNFRSSATERIRRVDASIVDGWRCSRAGQSRVAPDRSQQDADLRPVGRGHGALCRRLASFGNTRRQPTIKRRKASPNRHIQEIAATVVFAAFIVIPPHTQNLRIGRQNRPAAS